VGSYINKLRNYEFFVMCFDIDNMTCNFFAKEDIGEPKIIEQCIEYTDLDVSIKLGAVVDKPFRSCTNLATFEAVPLVNHS
jgi:hypothetical protein